MPEQPLQRRRSFSPLRRSPSFSPLRRSPSAAWLAKTKGVDAGGSSTETPNPRSLPAPKVKSLPVADGLASEGAARSSRKATLARTFSLGRMTARKPGKARRATGNAPATEPGLEEESVRAATKLQSLMRGRMARTGSGPRMGHLAEKAHAAAEKARAVRADAKALVNERIAHARFALLEKTVQSLIDGMLKDQVETDPWMLPQEMEWTKQLYSDLSKDISARMEQDNLELIGRGAHELRKAMDALVDPTTWPPPPRLWPWPHTYVRARFLYAIWSADKNLTYYFNVEPWMLWVNLMLVCPLGVSTLSWLYMWLCVIGVRDEFVLFNYVMMFKTYAFVCCGLLGTFGTLLADHFVLSGGWGHREAIVASRASSLIDELWFILDALFVLNWLLCFVAYWRYRAVRRAHLDGEPRICVTGDVEEAGSDWEQTYIMRYDLVATAVVLGLAAADLRLRVRVDGGDGMELHMVTIWLSVSALPWSLLKIPVVGDLIHQMRPTAFDQRGGVRLLLTPPQMKRKQERTLHVLREHGAEHKVRDVKNAKRRDYSQMQQAARDELLLQNSWHDHGHGHGHHLHRAQSRSSDGSSVDLEHGGGGAGGGEEAAHASVLVPRRLAVGARIRHDLRGLGTVTRQEFDRTHGHPLRIFVAFDSGESHGYKQESWQKLHEAGGEDGGAGAGAGSSGSLAEGAVFQGIGHLAEATMFHSRGGGHGQAHGGGHGQAHGHAHGGGKRGHHYGGAADRSNNRHLV